MKIQLSLTEDDIKNAIVEYAEKRGFRVRPEAVVLSYSPADIDERNVRCFSATVSTDQATPIGAKPSLPAPIYTEQYR